MGYIFLLTLLFLPRINLLDWSVVLNLLFVFQHDSTGRSSESSRSVEAPRTPEIGSNVNGAVIKERKERKESSDKKSNKAWYKMLNPTYKSRSEDLKRLFKDLPSDERLIVGRCIQVFCLIFCGNGEGKFFTTENPYINKLVCVTHSLFTS